jgi:hypothetical protein
MNRLRKFWHNLKIDLGITRPKRIGFRFVNWLVGDALIRKGWTLAKEEDKNSFMGYVCLELLEYPVKIK